MTGAGQQQLYLNLRDWAGDNLVCRHYPSCDPEVSLISLEAECKETGDCATIELSLEQTQQLHFWLSRVINASAPHDAERLT